MKWLALQRLIQFFHGRQFTPAGRAPGRPEVEQHHLAGIVGQLVDIAILVGTDFNSGVERVGSKTALNLIQKYGNLEEVIREKGYSIPQYEDVRKLFLEPEVTDDFNVTFGKPEEEKIYSFLCDLHNFGENRVRPFIDKLKISLQKSNQSSLDSFF